jgi:hypothetical protein
MRSGELHALPWSNVEVIREDRTLGVTDVFTMAF